jgi:putative cell wall-binding protein
MTSSLTRWTRLVVVAVALSLAAPSGVATADPSSDESVLRLDSAPAATPAAHAHPGLDRRLTALASTDDRRLPGRAPGVAGFDRVTDRVGVEVQATGGRISDAVAALRAAGGSEVRVLPSAILAEVPVDALTDLADSPPIAWVGASALPFADVTGQGVGVIGAPDWHADGFTGAGIKVAIIDLGFAGYESRLGAELPAKVHTFDGCGGDMGGTDDHGTAVAEIVHEVAPHATLYLMCVTASSDLAEAVDHAIAQGVTVINHSVGWFGSGRGDGTGVIGDIVAAARQAGILWVNSAGNYAEQHWHGPFVDTDEDGVHEFGDDPFDESIGITLSDGQAVIALLRWDDWPQSNNDYNIWLLDAALNPVAVGGQPQTGTQPPAEFLAHTHSGPQATYHLIIHRFDAPTTPDLDLFVLVPPNRRPIQHNRPERSVTDPASAPFVTAVGSFHWNTGVVRDFSSRGPNIGGLVKPDLTAPDSVATSFGGFAGTSAAAPHAAGAAALLQDAHTICAPATLHTLLVGSTDPVGDPIPNNDYGHGRLLLGQPPAAPDPVLRYAGPNRYATAAAISAGDFPCGSRTVFIATGENFPDALAGAAIAARFDAPILLVRQSSIPAETAAELARLDPDHLIVLGGEAAVNATVATQLGAYGTVTRLAGLNRFATAVEISQHAFPDPGDVADVFVATGSGFADALSGGPAAAYFDGPLLLVHHDSIPDATLVELGRLDPARVWVLGGPVAVSDAVVAQLAGLGFTVQRVAGANRYATAAAASTLAFLGPTLETAGSTVHRVYVAVGTNFPDALAGSAMAGLRFAPVLLVQPTSVPQVVIDEIVRLQPREIVILGGEAVVSEAVASILRGLLP